MQYYRLIFDGHIKAQTSQEDVQRKLAELFQVAPDQIESLFSAPPVVLKENLSYEDALIDKAGFEATGALCRLEAQSLSSSDAKGAPREEHSGKARADFTPDVTGERRFGLLHPYFLAFFSRPFYADVAAHWRGLAFGHLLLVLLLSASVYMMHFSALIKAFVTNEAPALIDQIPEIRIQDGAVQVDVTQPYTILKPNSDEAFAVIDTTGAITSLRQTEAIILLTESRLAVRMDDTQGRVVDLRQIESLLINQSTVSQWLQDVQKWAPFILFPLALGISFIIRSVQALLYGGMGLVLASLMNRGPLTFGAAVSIAIMAMTPVMLLDALLMLFEIYLPLWNLGGFLLAMGYLVFGIRSIPRKA